MSTEIDIYAEHQCSSGTPDSLSYQLAVMQAALEGKPVEMRQGLWNPSGPTPSWVSVTDCRNYGWNWASYTYRIDPASRPRIAQGHNPDGLTEDQVGVKEGWRLLEEQEIVPRDNSGVGYGEIEAWRFRKWERRLYNAVRHTGSCSDTTYRTQHSPGYFLPKPKAKVRVPLVVEDLPSLCWIRFSELGVRLLVTGIGSCGCGITTAQGDGNLYPQSYSMRELSDRSAEFSSDRKTWHPCWKEV
jgi:hypothetical protein